MKQLICMIVIISLVPCSFVSCSHSPVESEITMPENNAKALTIWTWRKNYNGRALEIAHQYFVRSNPDTTLNIVEMGRDEILSQLKIKFTIKDYHDLPDIVLIEDYQIQEILRKFPGEIRTLPATLDKEKFADCAIKASSFDGKMYGIPLDTGAALMFYRVDYIERAGYSAEDMLDLTWEKYIEIGKAVKEKTGKLMLTLTPTDLWQIRLMLQSAGQWYVKEDGITVNIANNPVLKDAVRTYIDIVKSGIALQVTGYDKEYGAVSADIVASVLTGTWRLQTMILTADRQEGKWAIAPIPRMSNHGSVNAAALGGYGWYVIDKSENADAAVDFLLSTLISDTDVINELASELALVSPLKNARNFPAYSSTKSAFHGQPSLRYLSDMIENVPPVDYGMHTYPIDNMIEDCVQSIMQGANIDDMLQNTQIIAEAIP